MVRILRVKGIGRLTRQVPNMLSLSRIPLLFLITGCLFVKLQKRYFIAFVLSIVACITDYLDGAAARRFNAVSNFGKLFDSLCDKILTTGIFIAFIATGIYPPIFTFPALIVLSREFIVTGLRMIAASQGVVMAAEKAGKLKTATQMVAVCASLLSYAIDEAFHGHPGTVPKLLCVLVRPIRLLAFLMFLVSSALAFTSGWTYLRRYSYLTSQAPNVPAASSASASQAAARTTSPASKPYDIISSGKTGGRLSRPSSMLMKPDGADPARSPSLPAPPPPKFN